MAAAIQSRESRELNIVCAKNRQRRPQANFILGACIFTIAHLAVAFVGPLWWTKNSRNPKMTRMEAADSRMTMPAGAMVEVASNTGQLSTFQVVVVFLCAAIPVLYWWFVIVPFKRREVATSKARGPMKNYLVELAATPQQERREEKWFYDKYLRQAKLVEPRTSEGLTEVVQTVEDELQETLPGGGFWSFDNPIFVCLVLLLLFCVQQVLLHDVLQK
mmetsp:Transcript_57421/g.90987  ORF Transcript_57421/g.90987 Transcript_57421/m.90987 type:complete len:218 (-) Transcript_57421:23-676(-)